ncbi:AcrR family transcriptional regulator [Sphingomonas insulae]|uniref:TetR/AcrR family transcriptional regulator n=1 Tax=Sphingomonas insulae TaxID=424800 RepID=A0ABN1HRQ6_9SPHN|nr:TetR/AcrR family transcriptional regulator [Sphingomonas insulae]NIJ29158.1 AcrR family transcriptional regulator [Sphingomonas insulae]
MSAAPSLRDLLVQRATELLDAGEHDVSLRAVARAAGVSAMAPYRHFPDKAALLRAVAERAFADLHDDLVAADTHGARETIGRALVEQGAAYVAFARRRPALFRLMFTDTAAKDGCLPGDMTGGEAYRVLARRVASFDPDDPDTATMAAWSIVHGMTLLILDRRLPPEPAAVHAALDLFVAGLSRT